MIAHMPRCQLEDLSKRKPTLVYIAGNVAEAEKAERVLGDQGIDYALTLDSFVTTSLLGGQYTGLFVYVPYADYQMSRVHLEAQGLKDTVELEVEE